MNRLNRKLSLSFAVAVCLWLTGVAAWAQTLTVVQPDNHIVSPRLSDVHGDNNLLKGPVEIPHHPLPLQSNHGNAGGNGSGGGTAPDAALQTSVGPLVNGTQGTDFDGLSVYQGGYIPSDNNIAVGPNHIMETVNAAYAVYSKTGALLAGPTSLRSLWTGLGGSCSANNGGDTVVQYDLAANRWIMTQLGSLSSPYSECIAVSTTSDPTGTYNLYSYSFGSNLNDYPKFGVWSTASNSAYLATYNLFANGSTFVGAEVCAYDRAGMIAGVASPKGLCFTGISGAGFLPADVDGPTSPLDGTPAYFVDLYSTSGSLGVYKLTPNFAASSATLSSLSTIPVAEFSQASPAPQPGTTESLDSLSDRLMYRLAFRMFPDHEAMVVNHSVTAGSVSGVRWYELRAPVSTSASFSVFQQGTYAPDSNYRWMGSAAMDQSGDIGIGYTVSSSTTYPSVRYTGRVPGDPVGTLETEAGIKAGAGSQTGYTRWGDYSSMRIDPSDDCTFWYVNEYLPVTSSYGWYTHIGSFRFSGCGQPPSPDFSLSSNPASLTLAPGNSGNSTITITSLAGFNTTVGLTVSGCPANTTCSLNPTSVTPAANGSATSLLTVATTSSRPSGTVTLTITGTGSSGTHTTTVSLTVNPPPGDFTISTSLTSLTVSRRSKNSLTVLTTAVGSSSSISLSVSGLPPKATASFSVNPVTAGGNSSLTISANPQTTPGTYTVNVTGNNGTANHSTSFTLTVN